jgi:hypothetical protein
MAIRIISAALIGTAALLLSGCGADAASASPPAPTSTVSGEDQIRDVIARVSEAHGTSDFAKIAPLTCAKYREQASEPIPAPMQFKLGKIENVLVNGDTATADVTLIIDLGGQFTYTADPSQFTLVKEDGQWKDCTPLDE